MHVIDACHCVSPGPEVVSLVRNLSPTHDNLIVTVRGPAISFVNVSGATFAIRSLVTIRGEDASNAVSCSMEENTMHCCLEQPEVLQDHLVDQTPILANFTISEVRLQICRQKYLSSYFHRLGSERARLRSFSQPGDPSRPPELDLWTTLEDATLLVGTNGRLTFSNVVLLNMRPSAASLYPIGFLTCLVWGIAFNRCAWQHAHVLSHIHGIMFMQYR